MNLGIQKLAIGIVFIATTQVAQAAQFVVELDAPLPTSTTSELAGDDLQLDQSFSAGVDSYAVFTTDSETRLLTGLEALGIVPEKVSEVFFVNSPEIGGGNAAGSEPRDGHNVYVIERPIPGVGFFGLEKKQKISKGSNAAVAKLGDIIEWDHSYLTSHGTYCVYRADSPETLKEHGVLAGAPIGKITPVTHKTHQN